MAPVSTPSLPPARTRGGGNGPSSPATRKRATARPWGAPSPGTCSCSGYALRRRSQTPAPRRVGRCSVRRSRDPVPRIGRPPPCRASTGGRGRAAQDAGSEGVHVDREHAGAVTGRRRRSGAVQARGSAHAAADAQDSAAEGRARAPAVGVDQEAGLVVAQVHGREEEARTRGGRRRSQAGNHGRAAQGIDLGRAVGDGCRALARGNHADAVPARPGTGRKWAAWSSASRCESDASKLWTRAAPRRRQFPGENDANGTPSQSAQLPALPSGPCARANCVQHSGQ